MIDLLLRSAPDWALAHAAPLLVMVPLVLAPVLTLVPNGRIAWFISIAGTAASLIFSLILLAIVQTPETSGVVSYAIGNWLPPLGIEFRVDALNAMILVLVSAMGVLASVMSYPTVVAEIPKEKTSLFYSAFLACFAGLCGVAITGDAFNLFVFLEISSLSTYVLVALGASRDRRALHAAFNYLVMGTIGATFFIIGVGFLYAATGTLNMADIASKLPALAGSRTVQAGFAFIVVGLGLKAAMWPLHQWLPNAYSYGPSFVTMFLSATATKVALYALIRFLFSVFNPQFVFESAAFTALLMPLGIAAMIACSFQAVFQTDVRRMLAYSSVAQVGYMILGISIGTAAGLSAGLFHLLNHAMIKGALFMAVAGVVLTYKGTNIRDFAGLGRSAPWTMTAFAIAGLSLIGVPLTAGFQSKLQLGYALFENGWWWAVILVVFSSFLAVIYVGRILEAVFFQPPVNPRKARKEAPIVLLVPLWILALANIYFGITTEIPLGLARDAAAAAFGLEMFR
ncbi:MAG: cation:proton antiporter [Hyphomonas sp. BRH_c22]|uniref:monovalent cation/H+ antiporter subunit D family protein n=1 Tax=Hyphomonas sp. BRH_c22 TaxID=1629710 RepID=UPI0005F10CD0|nr:monovalent cation/H+ antiporter subunit D family protein [Hyphomonas sp. BRH_c22]KJS37521.1 MAG: cation:proton antiporter [Hyphomonas sp. BRH_c22]